MSLVDKILNNFDATIYTKEQRQYGYNRKSEIKKYLIENIKAENFK